ncbi:MAG: LuxR C-terminal-related transcriptional regulator [bacterium]|jgi:DNA-binding CsgD family transcriptional regulator|nr:MAG: LuxR family transcriptional regulator [bacterium]
MDETTDRRLRLLRAIALASIFIGGTIDVVLDQSPGLLRFHILYELLMIVGAAVMALTLWWGWWQAEWALGQLRQRLEAQRAENDAWRKTARKALRGLGEVIAAKFDEWQLTPAEREVALLLLKGYSHKHVARLTGRSERTARQHAASVYQKAGLRNRAELAAYFLEDLILPEDSRILVSSDGAGQ